MTNKERLEKAKQIIAKGTRKQHEEFEKRDILLTPGNLVFCTKTKRRGVFIRKTGPMSVAVLFDGDPIDEIMIETSLIQGRE